MLRTLGVALAMYVCACSAQDHSVGPDEPCTFSIECASGLGCGRVYDDQPTACLQRCTRDADCGSVSRYCDGRGHCVLPCDPARAAACPGGMRCLAHAPQQAVCVY